jgi:hypothetical protein
MTTPSPDQKARPELEKVQFWRYNIPNVNLYTAGVNDTDYAGTYYRADEVDGKLDEVRAENEALKEAMAGLEQQTAILQKDCDMNRNRLASILFSGALDNITGTQVQEWAKEYEDVKAENAKLREALDGYKQIADMQKAGMTAFENATNTGKQIIADLESQVAALQSQALAEGLEKIAVLAEARAVKIQDKRDFEEVPYSAIEDAKMAGEIRGLRLFADLIRAEAEKVRKEKG